MKFINEFTLPEEAGAVWPLVLDIEDMAPCLPGATVTGRREDGGYDVTMSVALGPMRLQYAGELTILEADERARRIVLSARAREMRGGGAASATITTTLFEAEGANTRVEIACDLHITGRPAQMGRSIVEDVSRVLTAEFAECTAARLRRDAATREGPAAVVAHAPGDGNGEPGSQPIGVVRLLARVIKARLRRLLRRRRAV